MRPTLLYATKYWAVRKEHINKMCVAETRMLRWMCGKSKKDKIMNEHFREDLEIAPIGRKWEKIDLGGLDTCTVALTRRRLKDVTKF